jgi:hypothetical protein
VAPEEVAVPLLTTNQAHTRDGSSPIPDTNSTVMTRLFWGTAPDSNFQIVTYERSRASHSPRAVRSQPLPPNAGTVTLLCAQI